MNTARNRDAIRDPGEASRFATWGPLAGVWAWVPVGQRAKLQRVADRWADVSHSQQRSAAERDELEEGRAVLLEVFEQHRQQLEPALRYRVHQQLRFANEVEAAE